MGEALDQFEQTVQKFAASSSKADQAAASLGVRTLCVLKALDAVQVLVSEAFVWGQDNPEVVMLCKDIAKAVANELSLMEEHSDGA